MASSNIEQIKEIPILILGFNRLEIFKECIKRLKSNNFNNLWVALDGPREGLEDDQNKNKKLRAFCKYNNIQKNKTLFSKNNNGCRIGVMKGISWFFRNNSKGIIIEDDIEIDKQYINQIVQLLDYYENDKDIFSISSYSEYGVKEINSDKNYSENFFKAPLCRIWGWASWSDRWEKHINIYNKKLSENPIECFFNLPKKYRTANTALRLSFCKSGQIDTWDYEWNFSHVYSNSYSITPLGFFSLNYGFGSDATHTKYGSMPWRKMDNFNFKAEIKPSIINISQELIEKIANETGFKITKIWLYEFTKLLINIMKYKIKKLFNKFIKI